MSNDMVAGDVDRRLRHEFADGLLRPVHRFRQRRPGHPDADMLHAVRGNTRGFTGLADHGLQVFATALLADARQFTACTGGLAQQLRAVAHSAVCFGASSVNSQVQWHGWTLIHLPTTLSFAFKHFSRIMAWQTKPISCDCKLLTWPLSPHI